MQKAIQKKNLFNVFAGPEAIKNFLNPDYSPPLPLVEIPESLNPFTKDGVRIFAKLMNFLPLANVKSLPAYNMLLEKQETGKLKGVKKLIENSSGNTVFSLAVIGRIFGIPHTKAFVSHEVTWGKLQLLRLFGTEIIVNEEPICPDPKDKDSGIYKAKKLGRKKGWFNPGQYDNEANPGAHEKWTAPQIWEQTEGKISVFCAGLGTTGTMLGVSSYLKKKTPNIFTVGVARKPNNPVPGVRTPHLLHEIAFDWRNSVDGMEEIGTKESFGKSLELCRAGFMAGPSSGFALAGLLQFLRKYKKREKLKDLKNKNGQVIAVFMCPDSPLPYLNEYFEYLGESYFPKIQNEEILINKPNQGKFKKIKTDDALAHFDIDPEDAYNMIYKIPQKEAWNRLSNDQKMLVRPDVLVIDIRSRGEFLHFHIAGSERIDAYKITENLPKKIREWKKKKIILVCPMGMRTKTIAEFLRSKGIEAWSIRGGSSEWSAQNLPRWRPKVCKI